jgi:hypothetical protein
MLMALVAGGHRVLLRGRARLRRPARGLNVFLVALLLVVVLASCDRAPEFYFYAVNSGRVVGPFPTAEGCEAIRAEVDPRHGSSSCWRGR